MSARPRPKPLKRAKGRLVVIELTLEDPADPWMGCIEMFGEGIEERMAGEREPADAVDAMALAMAEQIKRLLAGRPH